MGNSQTKEARGDSGQQENGGYSSAHRTQTNDSHTSHRVQPPRRGSRPDFSSLLGIGSNEPDVASLEARRESKAEREQRKTEKEKQARLKERERSMHEEHVDGGYLVTQGVYVGAEDYNKPTVRQLMVERRLAPFWKGLDNFSSTWAEHQIMAAARGLPIPPADEVPPELEYQLSKRPSQDAGKSLSIPVAPRFESYQSDSGRASPANGSGSYGYPSSSPQPAASSSLPFRSRAKTLASLGSASRTNSEKDLSPRELKLPSDPFVNGQPIEVFLYKEPLECPICCLDYPPYLNMTRCCEQAICSECFVQIKRPDPHPPEHTEPDPNAPPVSEEERVAQAEGLLVSEVATCPFCKQPEFGITYNGPSFRRGLTYNTPYGVMSARSSQTSIASTGLSPGPGRRRGTSLSANAPEVITTDKIRPDWANKLATARAHAARRSAAASALHAAAYLMNDPNQRPVGPFGRRTMLRRSTLEGNERPTDGQVSALSFLAERQSSYNATEGGGPRRTSASRRSRMDDLEDMMMMEAIRLSLAAEEERRRKEEKEAKKKAKKEEKEQKKADKVSKKTSQPSTVGANEFAPMVGASSPNFSTPAEDIGKGKSAERGESPPPRLQFDGMEMGSDGAGSSLMGTSQESLTAPIVIPSAAEPLKRSHLRQMSNASSASSSYHEAGSGTPPVNEPLFNFQSLAAMIDNEEKQNRGSHVEHADDGEADINGERRAADDQGRSTGTLQKHENSTTSYMQSEAVSSSSR